MIRSFFSNVFLLVLVFVSITSCSSYSFDYTTEIEEQQLHEVAVSLSGINFTLANVPEVSSGISRSSDATPSEAGVTHIALKVFRTDGTVAANITQTATGAGDEFNSIKLQLPAGTYTFVAVAHSATDETIPCATITSATEATLPEGVVPTLFSHVQNVTVSTTSSNQYVSIEMGKRINATLHFTSTDVVPDDVASMNIEINPGGTNVKVNAPAKFNPSTGFVIGNLTYGRKLPSAKGQKLDASFNILLPENTQNYKINVMAYDTSKIIDDYSRTFTDVPFQRANTTDASGTYFRYVNSSSMTFDTTTQNIPFTY